MNLLPTLIWDFRLLPGFIANRELWQVYKIELKTQGDIKSALNDGGFCTLAHKPQPMKRYIPPITVWCTCICSACTISNKPFPLYRYSEREIPDKGDYLFRDISIKNTEDTDKVWGNNTISGTLISPKGSFDKVVVIVPGSGYNKKNSHFLLAEAFLKADIAVFRFDERGLALDFRELRDLRSDLFCVVSRLRSTSELKGKEIGLLGHSLGGLATIDVYQKRKADVDFLVQWATPIEKYGAFLKYQIEQKIIGEDLRIKGIKAKIELMESIRQAVAENLDKRGLELYKAIIKSLKTKGYKKKEFNRLIAISNTTDMIKANYEEVYRYIGIPMLYIIGSNDRVVDPKRNIEILKGFHNNHIKIAVMKGLNHYLNDVAQSKVKPSDIYRIDKTAMDTIIDFVRSVD